MEVKSRTKIVPFSFYMNNIICRVDKGLVLSFVFIYMLTINGYAQSQDYIDSLSSVYTNLKSKKEKVKLAHQLFKLTIHKNKDQAYVYAKEQLDLSKQINYEKGVGTAYRDFAYYYKFLSLPDSARHYYKKSVKTFNDNGNKERQCTALDRFASFESTQGNYETALELIDQSIAISIELKNGKILVDNLQRQSVVYLNLGDFSSAMDVTLNALKIEDTMRNKYPIGKAIGLSDIGRIEIHRKNFEAALEPTNKSLQLFKELKEEKWQAVVLNQLGNAYWHLENYDESLKAYQQSLEIVTTINRQDYAAVALANMAGIYSKKGDYKKAINMIEEAQAMTIKIGSIGNVINNYGMIGDIHLEHNRLPKAIKNYSRAIHIADSVNALDDLYDMYESRSAAYEQKRNYKKALEDYQTYKTLYDSVFSSNSDKHIEELKIKYESEKKEKELIIKENRIKLLEARKQKAENERLFLIISLIGALALVVAIVYGLRQKMKRHKIERKKLDNDIAFKEKELTTHALHLAHKNEVLLDLKSQLKALKSESPNSRNYQKVINTINLDISNDNNWEQFRAYFEDVHKDFNAKVMRNYPEVSNNDLRLMSLLKMNLSSKEIANILNISAEGVKKARYRLRKKLNLNTEESLQELVIDL